MPPQGLPGLPQLQPQASVSGGVATMKNPLTGPAFSVGDLRGVSATAANIDDFFQDQADEQLKEAWAKYAADYRKDNAAFAAKVESGEIPEFASTKGREFFYRMHAAGRLHEAEIDFEADAIPKLAVARDAKGNLLPEANFNEEYQKFLVEKLGKDAAFGTEQGKRIFGVVEPQMRARLLESYKKQRLENEHDLNKVQVHDRYGAMLTQLVEAPVVALMSGVPTEVIRSQVRFQWQALATETVKGGVLKSETSRELMGQAIREAIGGLPAEAAIAAHDAIGALPLEDGTTVLQNGDLREALESATAAAGNRSDAEKAREQRDYAANATKASRAYVDKVMQGIGSAKGAEEKRNRIDAAFSGIWGADSTIPLEYRDETQNALNDAIAEGKRTDDARRDALYQQAIEKIGNRDEDADDFLTLHRGALGDRYPAALALLQSSDAGTDFARVAGLEDAVRAIQSVSMVARIPSQMKIVKDEAAAFEKLARDKAIESSRSKDPKAMKDYVDWLQKERATREKDVSTRVGTHLDTFNKKRRELDEKLEKLEPVSDAEVAAIADDLTDKQLEALQDKVKKHSNPLYGVFGVEVGTRERVEREADEALQQRIPSLGEGRAFPKSLTAAVANVFEAEWGEKLTKIKKEGGSAAEIAQKIEIQSRQLVNDLAKKAAQQRGRDTMSDLEAANPGDPVVRRFRSYESIQEGIGTNPDAVDLSWEASTAKVRPVFRSHAPILDRLRNFRAGALEGELGEDPVAARRTVLEEVNQSILNIRNDSRMTPEQKTQAYSTLVTFRGLSYAEAMAGAITITIPGHERIRNLPHGMAGYAYVPPREEQLPVSLDLFTMPVKDLNGPAELLQILTRHNYPVDIASDVVKAQEQAWDRVVPKPYSEGVTGRPAKEKSKPNGRTEQPARTGGR